MPLTLHRQPPITTGGPAPASSTARCRGGPRAGARQVRPASCSTS